MKKISIQITDKDSSATEVATAEFEDKEIDLFKDYIKNTERLLDSKIVRDGIPGNLKMKIGKSSGISYEINLPDEDSILAFLHRMRRFILNSERSSYNKITGIIRRRFKSPRVRSIIKVQRKIYEGKDFQNMVQIRSDGEMINSEKILFDWLNAFEYHNDQTKKDEIEKLHQLIPLEVSRAVFLMLLTEKVKAIIAIANFIDLLLCRVEAMEAKA